MKKFNDLKDYYTMVDDALMVNFGITANDIDEREITENFEMGWSVRETIDYLETKLDLSTNDFIPRAKYIPKEVR